MAERFLCGTDGFKLPVKIPGLARQIMMDCSRINTILVANTSVPIEKSNHLSQHIVFDMMENQLKI